MRQHNGVGVPRGVRTPVTAVKGRCPRPLDDGDQDIYNYVFGGAKEDRTPDLLHAMQALSQLSYGPVVESGNYKEFFRTVKIFCLAKYHLQNSISKPTMLIYLGLMLHLLVIAGIK